MTAPLATRVHLNTAGAGLLSSHAVDTMIDVLHAERRDGAYETELRLDGELNEQLYGELARLVGAAPDDIAYFDSATRAYVSTLPLLKPGPGERVILSPYEYAGNLLSLLALRERHGFTIDVIPLDAEGDLDLEWLEKNVDDDVSFVSVPHVPSGCGIVNPVEEIGRILRGTDTFYVVDGCQSVGQLPVDVSALGCDLFTGAGRKFLCGPRGTGFAAVSERLRAALERGSRDLHVSAVDARLAVEDRVHTARTLELAERSTAVAMGFLTTLREAPDPAGVDNASRAAELTALLTAVPGIEVINPGRRQAGIVTFRHDRVSPAELTAALGECGITVWTITGAHTPQYMLDRGVTTAVRASVHWYTTTAQIEALAAALRRITS
ncbi:aminotransferase class V-fold PLP-dependent enzyme [Streptomyces sp. NPDC057496]|uniref:aminotransferase class V-fold PLP-dependent enzyme n=1 Tax=Streptomyces sp. NPDC057496 TaxID=3346149 RepID=UPI00367F3627